MNKFALTLTGVLSASLFMASGCKESHPDHAKPEAGAADHGHAHDGGTAHSDPHAPANPTAGHGGHGGAVIDLGSATIGGFIAAATRDDGQIVAGKDAPIDVTVAPAAGNAAKVVAVRFWLGTEDAKGSVKAKAEIENPAEPNRWHTHAEVPGVIPEGCKLWVEVEDDQGAKHTVGFDLKM